MYGDVRLGTTDESILLFLKISANKTIYDGILLETYPEMQSQKLSPKSEDSEEKAAKEDKKKK